MVLARAGSSDRKPTNSNPRLRSNMAHDERAGERRGELAVGTQQDAAPLDDVQRRLAELAARKRGRVRWRMSKHTAELAIRALEDGGPRRGGRGKQRRRKRNKRLL